MTLQETQSATASVNSEQLIIPNSTASIEFNIILNKFTYHGSFHSQVTPDSSMHCWWQESSQRQQNIDKNTKKLITLHSNLPSLTTANNRHKPKLLELRFQSLPTQEVDSGLSSALIWEATSGTQNHTKHSYHLKVYAIWCIITKDDILAPNLCIYLWLRQI